MTKTDYYHTRYGGQHGNLIGHEVVAAYSYEEACKIITKEPRFDVFFLDHDLEASHYEDLEKHHENTGFTFSQWMITTMKKDLTPSLVIVHSWNTDGARRIYNYLEENGIECCRWPFDSKIGLNLNRIMEIYNK